MKFLIMFLFPLTAMSSLTHLDGYIAKKASGNMTVSGTQAEPMLATKYYNHHTGIEIGSSNQKISSSELMALISEAQGKIDEYTALKADLESIKTDCEELP